MKILFYVIDTNNKLEIDIPNYTNYQYITDLLELDTDISIPVDNLEIVKKSFADKKQYTKEIYDFLNYLKYTNNTKDLYEYISEREQLETELDVFKYLYINEEFNTKDNIVYDFIDLMKDEYIDAYYFAELGIKINKEYYNNITFTGLSHLHKIPEFCKKIQRFYISKMDYKYLYKLQYLIFKKLDKFDINIEYITHCPKYIKIGQYEFDNIVNMGHVNPQTSYILIFKNQTSKIFKITNNIINVIDFDISNIKYIVDKIIKK